MRGIALGHIHLKVSDLARAEAFYTGILGLRVTERVGEQYVFLRTGDRHHDIALHAIKPVAQLPPADAVGLHHIGFEVPDRRALAEAYKILVDSGENVRAVDHGISQALYVEDPDGNCIEIYVDTRDRRKEWGGQTTPLDVDALLAELS